jgi:hypothetical protein
MNTKPAAPAPKLKPLDLPQRIIPVAWLRETTTVQCRIQPGYYLIGLRLRMQHIQRQGRPLRKIP